MSSRKHIVNLTSPVETTKKIVHQNTMIKGQAHNRIRLGQKYESWAHWMPLIRQFLQCYILCDYEQVYGKNNCSFFPKGRIFHLRCFKELWSHVTNERGVTTGSLMQLACVRVWAAGEDKSSLSHDNLPEITVEVSCCRISTSVADFIFF